MADKQNAAKAEKTKSADKKAKKPNIFVRAFRSLKNTFSRLAKYFRDVKSEMKKVVWPGKNRSSTTPLWCWWWWRSPAWSLWRWIPASSHC